MSELQIYKQVNIRDIFENILLSNLIYPEDNLYNLHMNYLQVNDQIFYSEVEKLALNRLR